MESVDFQDFYNLINNPLVITIVLGVGVNILTSFLIYIWKVTLGKKKEKVKKSKVLYASLFGELDGLICTRKKCKNDRQVDTSVVRKRVESF